MCDDAKLAAKRAIASMERMKGEIEAAGASADDAIEPPAAAPPPLKRGCTSMAGITVEQDDGTDERLIDLHGEPLKKVLRFPIGARVECRLGADNWQNGTIVGHRYRQKEWPDHRRAPYQVQIDGDTPEKPGPKIFVPRDGDDCVRTGLRFPVESVVECNLGDGEGWALGVVVQHYYHDPAWPPSQWVPYQIKLADGSGSSDDERLVWAPVDENDCVRAALFAPSFFDDKN